MGVGSRSLTSGFGESSISVRKSIDPSAIAQKIPFFYRLSLNKWYFDDIYDRLFVQGSRRLARQGGLGEGVQPGGQGRWAVFDPQP